ncbi:MtrAB system histidine kinase MtrB [Corynebacterium sp. CCM 9185]|uniref:Sensor histidine kinase MtrB n=1 Tax=Corynebacterium marambiense TaxID=2765364 RepID=A0ABS0VXZ7_9CORY|nr:MtrAB system histidine kinase MtrB [Corynebacterium marambiense]MBI9001660.1 HAMP domain-containing histidine kinase [Corynebacterium marambiense]MCK7662125.1 MtrAB system histidine kinase MtrB [Corynebacterium marambiense]MCX7541394.1 MtrAB system histidine kinase MtrB [Corynebacterium marambiense]
MGVRQRLTESWRTSLQVRVIGSILAASAAVVLILGLAMVSIVAQRLVDAKLSIATSEIDRARAIVEQQVSATDTSNSTQVRINSARAALTNRGTGGAADSVAVFEPVLVVADNGNILATSPEAYRIPDRLRAFVSQGQISYQYSTIDRADGSIYKALIIGTPTESDIPGLQLYLVLPLENEEATLALMRGLLSFGGVVLIVLLVGIAWLLTQQVTAPVRSASRIAQRFAAGHLRERMRIDGEDEMARLAISFNAMAESLSKQIHQLEEYGNLQRQFTSDVSHELRTPLTTVRMAADMIADRADELDPYTRRAAELMVRELDRFESLLADLLEISRHDAGVADLSEERIDLRTCVAAAWQQVKHLADELGVDVTFDQPADPVTVVGDARRIERILRNLLANAVDHSEGRPVMVRVATGDDVVAVTVTDHGVGLKPGQEALVFNRFWRADPSRVRHSGGTGLGLAISHEDAVLHGGALEAVGEVGVGSCFRLTLPFTPGTTWNGESPLPLAIDPGDPEPDQPVSPAAAAQPGPGVPAPPTIIDEEGERS